MQLYEHIIEMYHLHPLDFEGGWFAETYRSPDKILPGGLPGKYHGARVYSTAIYYLLTDDPDSFSAMHRLVSDEIYHFYLGDPVDMLLLYPDGNSHHVTLGQRIQDGHQVQLVVPGDTWQGSRLAAGGKFALMGTTVAPGFEVSDFTLGEREALLARWPQERESLAQLTRDRG